MTIKELYNQPSLYGIYGVSNIVLEYYIADPPLSRYTVTFLDSNKELLPGTMVLYRRKRDSYKDLSRS